MRRRDKFRFLSWQQRKVLVYAFFVLNVIRFLLWLLPLGKLRRQLEKILSIWVYEEKTPLVSVELITWAVQVAGRYAPGGAKCLAKALTMQLLMNRYGYPHKLCIGVAKGSSQTLEAHAWIEYEGQIVIGELNDLGRYKPFAMVGLKI